VCAGLPERPTRGLECRAASA